MSPEQRMLIEHDCRRLSLEFARLSDSGRYEDLAALFTPDGVFRRPLAPDHALRGREAILADLQRKPADAMSHHVCTNVLVDVLGGNDAIGLTYFTVYWQGGGVVHDRQFVFTGTVYLGTYSDRYLFTAEGWRIGERVGTNRFSYQASGVM